LGENNRGDFAPLTIDSFIRDIVDHPAFRGFGEHMLARDDNSTYYDYRISNAVRFWEKHIK